MNSDKKFKEHLEQGRISQKIKWEKLQQEYYLNPVKCETCKSPIQYKKRIKYRFCSSSCSTKFNNTKRTKDHGSCIQCNKKLTYKQNKFCSSKCCGLFSTNKAKESILNNTCKSKEPRNVIKKILIEQNGNKCSICSMPSEWEFKPIVMILDHIDGNSENNNLENLRLVCPNCDSQLPTFKGRNAGKGRFSRQQRYHQDKSY